MKTTLSFLRVLGRETSKLINILLGLCTVVFMVAVFLLGITELVKIIGGLI